MPVLPCSRSRPRPVPLPRLLPLDHLRPPDRLRPFAVRAAPPPPPDLPTRASPPLPAQLALRPRPARLAPLARLALGASALVLASCASTGPLAPHPRLLDTASLVSPVGQASPALATTATAATTPTRWPAADWFQAFGDPGLEALIDDALRDTPSLQAAQARASRAAAQAGISRAALGPRLDLEASSQRQRLSEHGLYPPPYAGTTLTQNNIQFAGSWELDLFGQHRAELDSAIGAARAAEADAEAARLLLSTNIARGWYGLARLLEQHQTLAEIAGQRRQTVDVVRQRLAAGLDTTVELRQAETQAFEIDRELAAVAEQIGQARHGLAALAGRGPEALATITPHWTQARPLAVPADVPADLLGRRADLTAARLRVEAGLQDVKAARAQFYPNISLSAFVGLNALGFPDWMTAGSRTFGIGPALHLPIFEAGRLRANLGSRSAAVDEAIASYNGALVDAVRDVADQLTSLQALDIQQQRQIDVQRSADEARALASARYRAGLGTILTVLQAQTSELSQRRVTTDLKYRVIDTQIALVRALGGGYQAPSSPIR